MNPDAQKEIIQYLKECEEKGIEPDLPRMVYMGHEVVYTIADSKEARWRCVICEHEWQSYDGFKCPKCFALKNPPRYICRWKANGVDGCGAEWFGKDGDFCPKCGKPTG